MSKIVLYAPVNVSQSSCLFSLSLLPATAKHIFFSQCFGEDRSGTGLPSCLTSKLTWYMKFIRVIWAFQVSVMVLETSYVLQGETIASRQTPHWLHCINSRHWPTLLFLLINTVSGSIMPISSYTSCAKHHVHFSGLYQTIDRCMKLQASLPLICYRLIFISLQLTEHRTSRYHTTVNGSRTAENSISGNHVGARYNHGQWVFARQPGPCLITCFCLQDLCGWRAGPRHAHIWSL